MKTIQVLKNKLTKMTVSKSNVHLITTTSFERKKKNPENALDGQSKELQCRYIKSLKTYQASHPLNCFLPARLSPRSSDI